MPRPSSLSLLVFAVAILTAVVLAGGGVVSGQSVSPEQTATDPASTVDSAAVETNTTYTVEIQTNGDAEWTITERFNVSTDTQRQEFDATAAAFESGDTEGASLGLDAFETAGELVDGETDRQMAITGVDRTSTIDGDVGTLSLSFTWESYARIDDDRIVLDDVYETADGLWFPGLTAGQELVVRSPNGFGFDDASVVPQSGELIWEGPTEFTNETLQAVLIGNGGDVAPGTPPGNGASGGGLWSSLGTVAMVVGGVGVLGAALVLVVMAVGAERIQALLQRDAEPDSEEPEPEPPATSAGTDADGDADLELLSDEERVERLLERNGGRMKQATIVKETGWSNAKVSQLLSSMEEEDKINKLRIGRENLISFPDEDVTDIGSE